VLIAVLSFALRSDATPLRMLVLSGGPSGSRPYPDFDYFSRQIDARMVFWHMHQREWDVYHLMDAIKPHEWKEFQKPLNEEAEQRLKELLGEKWDLVCWTGGDLASWVRKELLARAKSDQVVIRFGSSRRDKAKDKLAEAFRNSRPIDVKTLGAATPTGPGQSMPELRAAAPPAELIMHTAQSPCTGSAALPYDAVELKSIFWQEVVAHICGRQLPPTLAVRVPEKAMWGQPIEIGVDDLPSEGARTIAVRAATGRMGAETVWQGQLRKDGTAAIPTRGFPVGEWARVELVAEGHRPTIRWVELAQPVTVALAKDRWGADTGERIRLTVKTSNVPAEAKEPLAVRIAAADRRGRVVWKHETPVEGRSAEKAFEFMLPESAVDIYAYYVTAWLVSDGDAIGRASTTVYHYRPWDMRREWQWSVWDSIYRYSPYRAAAAMELFADAGFNSLGFGYANDRAVWWCERYGWRKYAELAGGYRMWNAPVIETSSDDRVRQKVRSHLASGFRYFKEGWRSAAFTLGSLGEEPGFKSGWGKTYYWNEEVAPPVAQEVFRAFLKQRYATIDEVAASWQTPLHNWEEARLTKKFALQRPKFDPTLVAEEAPAETHDWARYQDSRDFFTWYYRKVARFATEEVHKLNPGVRTLYSLAGPDIVTEVGEATAHLVYYPKEFQATAAARQRSFRHGMPVFSLIWNHYNWMALQAAGHWNMVANQATHTCFWLGFPLVFNDDLTHTRPSVVTKRFLSRFQPVSQLLAQATVAPSGVALLDGPSNSPFRSPPVQAAYSACAEAGFPPAFVDGNTLDTAKIVFASRATHVGKELAAALRQYVEGGGILITTAGFATRTERGSPAPRAPGQGLDKWMGFRFGKKLDTDYVFRGSSRKNGGPSQTRRDSGPLADIAMPSGPLAASLTDVAEDVNILARFPDRTPALLHRRVGKGSVYHLNFLHTGWGWATLYAEAREALRKIVSGIAERAGVDPRYSIECRSHVLPPGSSMPFWGSQLFVGRDRQTHYLVVFSDQRSPILTGRVHWYQDGWQAHDLLAGRPLTWTAKGGKGTYLDLALRPGDGRILALTPPGVAREPVPEPVRPQGEELADAAFVIPRGWPSEEWPRATLPSEEFVSALERLREVYRSGKTRRELSYYCFDTKTENRHALCRMLAEQRWDTHVPTLEAVLRRGASFLLTGEDTGLDPATGLHATLHRPEILGAVAQLGKRPDAKWFSASEDGQLLLLALGEGKLLLDRTSIDGIAFRDCEFGTWHEWWLPRIESMLSSSAATDKLTRLDTLTRDTLLAWLTGRWLPDIELIIDRFSDLEVKKPFVRELLPMGRHEVAQVCLPRGRRVRSASVTATVESHPGFTNGGCETPGKGPRFPLAGWTPLYYGTGGLDRDVKHSGKYSLRLHPRRDGNKSALIGCTLRLGRRDVNVEGLKYRLRLWAKAHKLGHMTIRIRSMQWGKPVSWDHSIWTSVGTIPGGTYDWRKFDFTVAMPATRTNYMELRLQAFGVGGTVWLDDLRGDRMPTASLGVGGEPDVGIPIVSTREGTPVEVSEHLAAFINAYLPRAPLDDNGLRVVPLHVAIDGPGRVTLSSPRIVLGAGE